MRPRLEIEIPTDYRGEGITPQISGNVKQLDSHYAIVARLALRNSGRGPAKGVLLIVTDVYILTDGSCSLEPIPQTPLRADGMAVESLPSGITAVFQVCGCAYVSEINSGFRIGGAPGHVGVIYGGERNVTFSGNSPTLSAGLHIIRLVACADGIKPTRHLLALGISEGVEMRLATEAEKDAVHAADAKRRAAVQISRG
jgi:hypothetical protein